MDIIIPSNCYLEQEEILVDGFPVSVLRCIPYSDRGVIRAKKLGGMTTLTLMRTKLATGVDTHEVHAFNVASGFLLPDEETVEERKEESRRVSLSRSISSIRELVACNPWRYFVTITLDPQKWKDRQNPETLQNVFKSLATKWKRIQRNKAFPYKEFKFLIVPELHEDGAVHLHGFVNLIPPEYYVPYTLEDIRSDQPLPQYICDAVLEGREIAHCTAWDELFGYNIIEDIKDQDRAANYATKYITKSLGATPFTQRYWCSRGLQRAVLAGEYRIEDSEDAVDDYNELVIPYAAVTPAGEVMHREYYRPASFSQSTHEGVLAGIHTTIDRETLSTSETLALLGQHYPSQQELDKPNSVVNSPPLTIDDAFCAHESVLDRQRLQDMAVAFEEVETGDENPFL